MNMCGIIGYKGNRNASEIVVEGLKTLEYRGYDSWGVALKNSDIHITKRVGKIGEMDERLAESHMGIAHTRWATHGGVTKENAHPHSNGDKSIVVVHNGIIENYQELRRRLTDKGHVFVSETDTEVIPFMIEENMKVMSFAQAMRAALQELKGNYAVVAMHKDSDIMVGARKGSPLLLGVGQDEYFLASDAPAFMKYTNKVVFLDDGEMVILNKGWEVIDVMSGDKKICALSEIDIEAGDASKGDYPHFMLKEIYEQPDSLLRTVNQREQELLNFANMISKGFGVFFVACGTAYHACLTGSYMFSNICHKHVNQTIASEFKNYEDFLTEKTLVVPVSQSGETADVLDAVKAAKKRGAKIFSIINVAGSSLSRKSDNVFYINAGPEIGVASTKAFTSQTAVMLMLSYACKKQLKDAKDMLFETSDAIGALLKNGNSKIIKELAHKIKDSRSIFTLGRGMHYPVALEAALKIKEISYIHAEGFPGGELKHGTIALIEKGTPCIVFVPNDETKDEIISNAIEVKSRGALVIGVGPENNEIFDYHIKVPDLKEASCIANIVPIQLLAYNLALELGLDPDKPRNLAKSVTVK